MTNLAYEKYRAVKIENGKVYQDFIVDACWNLLGLAIDANKYAAAILHPLASDKIAKVIGDVSKLGRELHEATKRNIAQLDLFRQDDPQ